MVKFGLTYSDHTVRRWRSHYVDYTALKGTLKSSKLVVTRPKSGSVFGRDRVSSEALESLLEGDEFHAMEDAAEEFYLMFRDQLERASRHYNNILLEIRDKTSGFEGLVLSRGASKSERYDTKDFIRSAFNDCNMALSFACLNTTACHKVLKKFRDPRSCGSTKDACRKLLNGAFKGDDRKKAVIETYGRLFCNGDAREAEREVRAPLQPLLHCTASVIARCYKNEKIKGGNEDSHKLGPC